MPTVHTFESDAQAEQVAVMALTYLIRSARISHEQERGTPRRDADASDHYVAETGERVKMLVSVRDAIEVEMARSLHLDPR